MQASFRRVLFPLVALAAAGAIAAPGFANPASAELPAIVAFAPQAIGTASRAQAVTLRNAANAPLRVGVITAIGDFQVASNGCPAWLAPQAACTFTVRSIPGSAGPIEGRIVVAHDEDNGSSEIDLLGAGLAAARDDLAFSANNLHFTPAGAAQPATQSLALTNRGTRPVTLSLIEPDLEDFEVVANECERIIAPGTRCRVQVRFAPRASGARNGLLWLMSDVPGSPHAIGLSGSGAQALAAASPR